MTHLDPLPAALQSWQNFYMLIGAAAATLLGLMFVAVTFGSRLVTRQTVREARAFIDPAYLHFAQVLITAVLLTVPTLGPRLLGGLLIVCGGFQLYGLLHVFGYYREAQRKYGDIELSDWIFSILLPFFCHLLLAASGVGFLFQRLSEALTGLCIVNITLLAVSTHSAWELLVWMAQAVSERGRE